MTTMTTTALAQWFGSNRTLASAVGDELAGCDFVGVVFAGGMSELPYIKARQIAVNDKHRHLINLARVCGNRTLCEMLRRSLRGTLFHPDELAQAQERCVRREAGMKSPHGSGLFSTSVAETMELTPGQMMSWARDYFVCTWMTRAGSAGTPSEFTAGLSVRWSAGGGGSAVRFRSAWQSLRAWRRVLQRCEFSTLDAFEFLAMCKNKPGHGVYCDPPFPGPGDAYTHQFSDAEHRRLAVVLSGMNEARVVCRFYDHPLVRDLYPVTRWRWRFLEGRKQTNEAAPEVLLINDVG